MIVVNRIAEWLSTYFEDDSKNIRRYVTSIQKKKEVGQKWISVDLGNGRQHKVHLVQPHKMRPGNVVTITNSEGKDMSFAGEILVVEVVDLPDVLLKSMSGFFDNLHVDIRRFKFRVPSNEMIVTTLAHCLDGKMAGRLPAQIIDRLRCVNNRQLNLLLPALQQKVSSNKAKDLVRELQRNGY